MAIGKISVLLVAMTTFVGQAIVNAADTTPELTVKPEHVSSELLSIYDQKHSKSTLDAHACSDVDRAQAASCDSVVVEAIAKVDPDLLLEQLKPLGFKHAQVAGPVVSGYLPICAIPELESCCSELRFVRKSISALQKQ
jgi:hypothetical protein